MSPDRHLSYKTLLMCYSSSLSSFVLVDIANIYTFSLPCKYFWYFFENIFWVTYNLLISNELKKYLKITIEIFAR